jgi:hypothetical protein
MKLRQRILKRIINTDLAIGNDYSIHHTIGSPFYIGQVDSIKNLFTDEEMEMIADNEQQLPEIVKDSISFEEFMKLMKKDETN